MLLKAYDSPTGSESTSCKDISILVSSLELNIWECEAFRRLRTRRLPVILKFVFTIGSKALIRAARDGGNVLNNKFVTFSARVLYISIIFE